MYTAHHAAASPPLIKDVLPCVWNLSHLRGSQNINKLWWRRVEYEYKPRIEITEAIAPPHGQQLAALALH